MSWDRLKRITEPSLPVTLAVAKDHLRVRHTKEDALITRQIKAAAAEIEGPHGIGILLGTQTWTYNLDKFPSGAIEVPLAPVQAVTAITYIDTAGEEQTFEDFQTDLISSPTRIEPNFGKTWPSTRDVLNAVTVEFAGGHEVVPEDLKDAVLLFVAHKYYHRGDSVEGLTPAIDRIRERYRVGRFG